MKDLHSHSTEILIATLNEEQGIGLTITELRGKIRNQRLLVIDGHSRDKTVEVAKNCGAEIIFQDGIGKGDAISTALRFMDSKVDYIVLIDADHTYPAEYVPDMIGIVERNPQVGMVCGNRFDQRCEENAMQGWFFFGNRFLAFAHSMFNGIDLKDPLTGLRVVRAEILRKWAVKSKGFDIEVELNNEVHRQGFRIVEVPIKYRVRLGEKKLKMRHGFTILKRILLEAADE